MEITSPSDILKMAILMEKRGRAFYTQVASQTEDDDVRRVFQFMADEEQMHVEFLSKQFSHYEKHHSFDKNDAALQTDESTVNEILSQAMKTKIDSAGYEAAAISAAIDFETRAIEVYSKRAAVATDPNEIEMFTWLAEWERGHHKVLNELNQELMEKVWNDNQFWPF